MRPLPAEMARANAALEHLVNETRAIRSELAAQQRQMAQIGWAMFGTTVAGIIAIIVALG